MKLRLLPLALAGLAVVAAGCSRGDDDGAPAAQAAPASTTAPAKTAAPAAAPAAFAAKAGDSALGKILAGTDGLTLYGFVNDVNAISTCYSTCAEAWPPVIVGDSWSVGPGLDTGIFSTTRRDDGTLQLVAGKFPLYTYGGDAAPGDLTGQGSGDVWFAVALDGTLITDDAAAPAEAAAPPATEAPAPPPPAFVQTAPTGLGDALVDAGGLTLYGFTNDVDGHPTCEGDRRMAAAAGRRAGPAGRPRPGRVLRRRAWRRKLPAQGREVAAVPVRR
jgi:predicted lipoprotein with Yx(FWY)xxD motif